jgi:uncharacterized protein YgiM (DUF1202 family)
MNRSVSAVFAATGAAAVLIPLALASAALAQSTPTPTRPTPEARQTSRAAYDATVTVESTLVRAAPSVDSGYAFGGLRQGTTVRVIEEQVGWVAVELSGDAFNGWFGYVQAGPGITPSADGGTLRVASRAQVSAPNAEADWSPESSWKAIGFLVANDEVPLLGEVKGQRDTYYKVALGPKMTGWVSASAVTRAVAAETTEPTTTEPTTTEPTTTEPTTTPAPEFVPSDAPVTEEGDPVATGAGAATTTAPTLESQPVASATPPAATTEEARRAAVARANRVRFSDVDAVWKRVSREPVENAELEQLRERFLALAEDTATPRSEAIAATRRAEQIGMRVEVQRSLLEIAALKAKTNADIRGVADLELAMRTRQPWDAVGRLNASSVYNGERLPLLYRLQDQGTGQTIAYILPTQEFDLPSMLGLLVGVKGPIRYDESLRLNLVQPTLVGPLSSTGGESQRPAPVTASGDDAAKSE